MKNGKLAIFITLLLFVVFVFSYVNFIKVESDAVKFKKEYETLNGKVATDKIKYQKLNISSNNPMKYASYSEIFDMLDNGTGVIYLGFPNCPWCRTILPVLFDALEKNNVEEVLYMNIYEERDAFKVEDGKLIKSKEGSKGYYKLLKKLDKNLEDYKLVVDGKEYDTHEKRIYAPTVIFVKNGEVVGIHVSSVPSQKSGFDKLTKDEIKELYGIYEDYIFDINALVCDEKAKC